MKISEIHFNHAPDDASHDAFNLRWNEAGPAITSPEWTFNGTNYPAAYAREALEEGVTIKVAVADGPPGEVVEIRALDTWYQGPGWLSWFLWLAKILLPEYFGGALGAVAATSVQLDKTGNSAAVPFRLVSPRIHVSPVGVYPVSWMWQMKNAAGRWVDIGESKHQIFITHHLPTAPWQPVGPTNDPTQVPWVDALAKACQWAQGAPTSTDIARSITEAINGLREVGYTGANIYWDPLVRDYELTGFLHDLADSAPLKINCRGCADAVVTFANVLGADLETGVFERHDEDWFQTRDVIAIGGDLSDWQRHYWSWHEVAWRTDNHIFDACLRIDIDPDNTIMLPRLPLDMPFGPASDESSYLAYLIGPDFQPKLSPRQRKPVS